MKKYKAIFSSFHTLYRLTTSISDPRSFVTGTSRLYRNIFKAEKVIFICRIFNQVGFIRASISNKKQIIKRGGISILTRREREIMEQATEFISDSRMIYPFVFLNTLGAVYIKRAAKSDPFDELEKRWFVALSEQISIYLKIFSLYNEQKKILIGYIKSITSLLDKYIPTSYLHTKSVFKLIRELGKEMKLTSSEIKSLEYASMLHDAGKLQIPTHLLKKQRPLTKEEYDIIRTHPRQGAALIKELSLLKPVAPIILHHHERYDGTGYPSRLKKEEIPLGSRILAIIDAFDAMFFGRPYKKRMKLEEVEKELKLQRGRQFDPKITDAFLKILRRKSIRNYLNSFTKSPEKP